MRLVFFMTHPGLVRNFESTLRALAEDGHGVELVFDRAGQRHEDGSDLVARLASDHPSIASGPAPRRARPRIAALARRLRYVIDYLRYRDPLFARAQRLRERVERPMPPVVGEVLARGPLATPSGAHAARAALRAVERAVPVDPAVVRFLRDRSPDAVLVTPMVELGSAQVDYVRAARRLGIPSVVCVFSWDNLTNRGVMHEVPDLVTVWNEAQRREAIELHDIPPDVVVATGAPGLDAWFERTPSESREAFARKLGLDGNRPIILYVCSSPFIAPRERDLVTQWAAAIRASDAPALRDVAIVVRPHPLTEENWASLNASDLPDLVVWPPSGTNPIDERSRRDYFDSLFHADVVVGVNTSAQIEAAVRGRPVLAVTTPEYRATDEDAPHFQHLVGEAGLLRTACSFEEHARQLQSLLAHPIAPDPRSERFVRRFVRPLGLDVSATEALTAEVYWLVEQRSAVAHPVPGVRAASGKLVSR
jgi:hypothetical protein